VQVPGTGGRLGLSLARHQAQSPPPTRGSLTQSGHEALGGGWVGSEDMLERANQQQNQRAQ